MQMNFWVIFLAALVPLLVGFGYYNKNVAGNIWMQETGMTEEKGKSMNMLKTFGLTYLLSILLAFLLQGIVIHQSGLFSLFFGSDFETAGTDNHRLFNELSTKFAHTHRGWKHGLLHGTMASLFFALPIITINALFEMKSWRYIAVNVGFWTICLAIMGGLLCAYL
jgi:hypothetical protein